MNRTGIRRVLMALGILFLPALTYLICSRGKNNFKHLEIYGPKDVVNKTENGKTFSDTIYHTIPDFSFTDQYGRTITEKTFTGTFYVTDFFFTTCKTICPKMSQSLEGVAYEFRKDSSVKIISHTVDPESDSVPALAAYAKQHNAVKDIWYFVTGDKKQIYDLARTGYYLPVQEGNGGPDDFIHSDQMVLVDPDKRIRGFYDGTDPMDVKRLKDEILVLQWEYKQKGK